MQVPIKEVDLQQEEATREQYAFGEGNLSETQATGVPINENPTLKNNNSTVRRGLNFSLIGLILSVFCGLGLVFSIIGTVFGSKSAKYDKTAARYSIGMGIAGIVLSSLFIILTIVVIAFLLINAVAPL